MSTDWVGDMTNFNKKIIAKIFAKQIRDINKVRVFDTFALYMFSRFLSRMSRLTLVLTAITFLLVIPGYFIGGDWWLMFKLSFAFSLSISVIFESSYKYLKIDNSDVIHVTAARGRETFSFQYLLVMGCAIAEFFPLPYSVRVGALAFPELNEAQRLVVAGVIFFVGSAVNLWGWALRDIPVYNKKYLISIDVAYILMGAAALISKLYVDSMKDNGIEVSIYLKNGIPIFIMSFIGLRLLKSALEMQDEMRKDFKQRIPNNKLLRINDLE